MRDVIPFFDAGRMADEYYQKLYHFPFEENKHKETSGAAALSR
jgi:hypothetical protein